MGYSKFRSRSIKNTNHLRIRTKNLEIITPNIVLTKPVEKIEVKNNKRDTD